MILFVVIVLFFQYRTDYGVDVSPLSVNEYENCINVIEDYEVTVSLLSEYVEKLDSEQKSFLERNLPNPLNVLTTPQEISNDDFRKDIVDVMMESQEYRSLIFHIASIPADERKNLARPALLEKSWDAIVEGNNADYAVLNYYVRSGLLK